MIILLALAVSTIWPESICAQSNPRNESASEGTFVSRTSAANSLLASPSAESVDENDELAQQPDAAQPNIEALITQLDSGDYASREEALVKLAKIGEEAIEPLAEKSFDCTAETQWRIKKTLEAICTSGAEDVFYKALSVIKVRFNESSSSNSNLNESLRQLEQKWRKKRKSQAIANLRNKGATVTDPLEDLDELNDIRALGGNIMIINGGIIEINSNRDSDANSRLQRKTADKRLSDKEIRAEIKTILSADMEENRERVFGETSTSDQATTDVQRALVAQVQLRNRIRANQLLAAGAPINQGNGITIEIGENWNGTDVDYKLIRELENVDVLKISAQTITSESILGFNDNATLSRLILEDCKLEEDVLSNGKWSNLNEIEFTGFDIGSDLIESITGISSLQMLTFDDCRMRDAALAKLKELKNLRGLQFKETEIDKSIFGAIASLKQVTYVNLSVCKFTVADYKQLKTDRPGLQIAYTAQAFFGVRGPINTGLIRPVFDQNGKPLAQPTEQDCSISDVIANSGAFRAGI